LKKIRYNNPLQILPNAGYRKLLAYWGGKGPKPSAGEAEAALMQFATQDVRYQNNVFHKDVFDALFRAPLDRVDREGTDCRTGRCVVERKTQVRDIGEPKCGGNQPKLKRVTVPQPLSDVVDVEYQLTRTVLAGDDVQGVYMVVMP
jgi:hypothetical protein